MAIFNEVTVLGNTYLPDDTFVCVVNRKEVTVSSTVFVFEKYSNGMKSVGAANTSTTSSRITVSIPDGFKPYCTLNGTNCNYIGMNNNYSATATSTCKSRLVGINTTEVTIYASPYVGCFFKYFYM